MTSFFFTLPVFYSNLTEHIVHCTIYKPRKITFIKFFFLLHLFTARDIFCILLLLSSHIEVYSVYSTYKVRVHGEIYASLGCGWLYLFYAEQHLAVFFLSFLLFQHSKTAVWLFICKQISQEEFGLIDPEQYRLWGLIDPEQYQQWGLIDSEQYRQWGLIDPETVPTIGFNWSRTVRQWGFNWSRTVPTTGFNWSRNSTDNGV